MTTIDQDEVDELVKKRGHVKGRVTSIYNYVQGIDLTRTDPPTLKELEIRGKKLDELYDTFTAYQDSIEDLYDGDVPAAQLLERDTFESRYFRLVAKIQLSIFGPPNSPAPGAPCAAGGGGRQSVASQHSVAADITEVSLPKIPLPTFDGSCESWLQYRDTFESIVHTRAGATGIVKFHYLRESLVGEAKHVLSSIEFAATNYQSAWNILCERYNNPRILIHKHIKSLLSGENIRVESASKIRGMLDNLSKHLCALQSLGENTTSWDSLLIFMLSSKLDSRTARDWEEVEVAGTMPTLGKFKKFLKLKANQLESIELKRSGERPLASTSPKSYQAISPPKQQQVSRPRSFTSSSRDKCSLCQGQHQIYKCSEFLKLSTFDRYEKAKLINVCVNCLHFGHQAASCEAVGCRKCGKRHHVLLHHEFNNSLVSRNAVCVPERYTDFQDSNSSSIESPVIVSSSCANGGKEILLATALVNVKDSRGKFVVARALLDSASQSSFVSSGFVSRLRLATQSVDITIVGISHCKSAVESRCLLEVCAQRNAFSFKENFLVIPQITSLLPSSPIDEKALRVPSNLRLADPGFCKPSKIDLLIGADCFWSLISIGQVSLGPRMPTLQKTVFGWIVSGPSGHRARQRGTVACDFVQHKSVEEQIARFWELEDCPSQNLWSKDEHECEDHFAATTIRDATGRFVVDIPTRNLHTLGNSFEIARRRFENLERRFVRNPALKISYATFINEYIELGHMREVVHANCLGSKPAFYLPHHPVFNESSASTKLRVVFDGSAKSSSGVSLNDCQLVGPTIQDNLLSILLRFRKFAFVVCADVRKMYRQILVAPEQRCLQRVVWRDQPHDALKTYELQTVTYGTASASFLAIRSLHEIANIVEPTQPRIAQHIRQGFYVDDLNTGADNIEEARQLAVEMKATLAQFGFELDKWKANDARALMHVLATENDALLNEAKSENREFDIDAKSKTLGLFWSPTNDILTFSVGDFAEKTRFITKRSILSQTAQIFDPLGLIAPCTVTAKIFMQRLWELKLTWDESLPASLHTEWLNFVDSVTALTTLAIPRHFLTRNWLSASVHGFCDASERAYGACVYVVSTAEKGNAFSHLVCSKTKVAPLKQLSIPRLELCSAQLLAKLIVNVIKSLNLTFEGVTLWTDSTVTLGWINSEPNKNFRCESCRKYSNAHR